MGAEWLPLCAFDVWSAMIFMLAVKKWTQRSIESFKNECKRAQNSD
jgi:hypothetical protein